MYPYWRNAIGENSRDSLLGTLYCCEAISIPLSQHLQSWCMGSIFFLFFHCLNRAWFCFQWLQLATTEIKSRKQFTKRKITIRIQTQTQPQIRIYISAQWWFGTIFSLSLSIILIHYPKSYFCCSLYAYWCAQTLIEIRGTHTTFLLLSLFHDSPLNMLLNKFLITDKNWMKIRSLFMPPYLF